MSWNWGRPRRKSISKDQKGFKGYEKDANAVYRGILRDRAKRRYSKPHLLETKGKILTFDWDLFITDVSAKQMDKSELKYDYDYLILRGNYSGRIARYVGTKIVKKYASFKSYRNNEIRVNCATPGFGIIPKLGCWMESLSEDDRIFNRPPILLIQAKSIVGDIPNDIQHIAMMDEDNLVASWSYKSDVNPECIDLPKIEETIIKLGSHKRAHPTLKLLIRRGFYVCYEDDGWLVKCSATQRLRFMRRSHLYSITICRCGRDLVDAMMNDFSLRTLLPVSMFCAYPGIKQKQRPGHLRRSSSMGSFGNDLQDFNMDLIDDYDKSECYKRIFNREGAVDGNCLVLDTPFLDAVRSYISMGGLAKNCIVPNIIKWRRMIKYAAGGDDPYLLMSNIRIVNCQWSELMTCLPNNRYKKYSFSIIYYDGTTKIDSPKISHKIVKEIQPKSDILYCFKNKLFMNGGYLSIALSRRNVKDKDLSHLFDNVENFIIDESKKCGYITRRIALGVHIDKQIYVDFQVFVKTKLKNKKHSKKKIKNKNEDEKNNDADDDDDSEDDYSVDDSDDDDNDNDDEVSDLSEEQDIEDSTDNHFFPNNKK